MSVAREWGCPGAHVERIEDVKVHGRPLRTCTQLTMLNLHANDIRDIDGL